jgi:hypothetical protein
VLVRILTVDLYGDFVDTSLFKMDGCRIAVTGVCKAAMADAGSILLSVWLLSVMN